MSMESRSSSFMQPRAKDLTIFALQVARGMAHLASFGVSIKFDTPFVLEPVSFC